MKKKEIIVSLLIYIPLGVSLSYINYKSGESLFYAILFGFLVALVIFFVTMTIFKIKRK